MQLNTNLVQAIAKRDGDFIVILDSNKVFSEEELWSLQEQTTAGGSLMKAAKRTLGIRARILIPTLLSFLIGVSALLASTLWITSQATEKAVARLSDDDGPAVPAATASVDSASPRRT